MKPDEASGQPVSGSFYQIGVVVRDLDKAMARYGLMFGVRDWKRMDTDYVARYRDWEGRIANRNAFAPFGKVHLEMIEPGAGLGNAREWLETRGEGIFHLGFAVDEVAAQPGMGELVFEVKSQTRPDGSAAIVHIDTVATLGYFTELTWRPMAEKLDDWVRARGA